MRATFLLLFNIFVRLLYPSAYFPASASQRGLVASPMTARCIAFMAEFALYEVWAVWAGVDFWGPSTHLWLMVGAGEVISTLGVLVQSEIVLTVEDSIWTLHTWYMVFLSFPQWRQLLFFGGFGTHMLVTHLPRRFRLLFSRSAKEIWSFDPLFTGEGMGKVRIRPCEHEEKAWVVPMLLGQPVLCAIMYWDANGWTLGYE